MSRISLSGKHAQALSKFIARAREEHRVPDSIFERMAIQALRAALAPRAPKPMAVAARKVKQSKREQKNAETARLRAEAMIRSGGDCECGCRRPLGGGFGLEPEMDHAESRRVPQKLSNVWILARACHRAFTNPWDARVRLEAFIAHCDRHGYVAEAERARARLEGIVAVRARGAGR